MEQDFSGTGQHVQHFGKVLWGTLSHICLLLLIMMMALNLLTRAGETWHGEQCMKSLGREACLNSYSFEICLSCILICIRCYGYMVVYSGILD